MDMEQHQNDTIKQSWDDRHIKEKNCSDQKDHPFSGEEDGKCDIPPDPTWRVSKVPLPDQGLAFKAALQGPTRPSTAMRFGDYEGQARVDKENYPEVKEYGFQPANPDSPKTRMPKRPLAAQGMAFQAALQQSDSVSPNIRGGASRHGEENVNIRIKGAAGAAVQHRAATRRGQLDKNMQPRQQRRLH